MSNAAGRIVLLTAAGVAAGLLTWAFSDLSSLIHLPDTSGALTARQAGEQVAVGIFFGAMIGLLLGVADMFASGTREQWARVCSFGVLVGAAAGFVGINFGASFYAVFHQRDITNPLTFLLETVGRAIGWAFIGALAGGADGVRRWSGRTLRNGIIGGFIGGLIGGTVFEAANFISFGVPRPAVISRLLGFMITGALIGLFVGLVQQLLKEAWVRVVVGKNEGREILVDKTQTTIGRSELSDIGLFGDRTVAKTHALIVAAPGGGYVLRDVSGESGAVSVNGRPVAGGADAPIKGGDTFKVGGKTLLFFERLTKERTVVAKDGRRASSPPIPPTPFPPSEGEKGGVRAGGGAGQARLVAIAGPYAGQTWAVRSGAVIGRDPAADIALPNDTGASRRHAWITQEALSFAIEDSGSTNGTFVNGQRVTRQSLVPGDTVQIGATSLRLE